MTEIAPKDILDRYRKARDRRSVWESHWQECYDYALPLRDGAIAEITVGDRKNDRLFDATAPDAVDQLAATLLASLTPSGTRWFGFRGGPDLEGAELERLAPDLERSGQIMQTHFDRSNFVVEIHQCFLDLVTAGTACLLFEEAPVGADSAFRFAAVPLGQVVLEDGGSGRLDTVYRRSELTADQFRVRFPDARLPPDVQRRLEDRDDATLDIVEAVIPRDGAYAYWAILAQDFDGEDPTVLRQGLFAHAPFIAFRWVKAPGEAYGRSPVMKALPDIKTANKVVELVLKNASINVTGIWQADDDGVLNPATIKLVPGAIIPKAVGSDGLTPLQSPGDLNLGQVVLDTLRGNIRRALLVDKLGSLDGPRMTATEVLERSRDMARLLGAPYGRLRSELLNPLVMRAQAILRRRGEIPDLRVDERRIALRYQAVDSGSHMQAEANQVLAWLETLGPLGPQAQTLVDPVAAARWLARAFNVPDDLLQPPAAVSGLSDTTNAAGAALAAVGTALGGTAPETTDAG